MVGKRRAQRTAPAVGIYVLRTLRLRNFALAEDVGVEFEPALNVITGETGAGKSLLVGALALLLGERADKDLIRTGADACTVEAVFETEPSSPLQGLLEEAGLPPCENGRLILRRIVRGSGSPVWINDSPTTLAVLRRIGESLVDLHGPHDQQSLFQPAAQMDVLDAFGGLEKPRAAYGAAHQRVLAAEARRAELTRDTGNPAEEIERLEWMIKEIEGADPKEGEEEEVRREHDRIGHAQRILELAAGITQALTEAEDSAFARMASTQRAWEELTRLMPEAAEWRSEVVRLTERVRDVGFALMRAAEAIDVNPSRLDWLDRRLATYASLRRKYGNTVAEMLAAAEKARQRLEDLRMRGERLAAVEAELAEARAEREKRGLELRRRRRAVADELAEAITGELEFLGFPGSAFAVDLSDAPPGPSGMDAIEFGFAPNVGEAMRPLRAIASSGEISRVMLAVKAVLAQQDRVPVLVFDEIDANLGGETGHAVGRELAGVADRHQVICITHLPQVAVHGTAHYVVSKSVRDGRTYSTVERVEGDRRVAEIVRMLGGDPNSEATVRHAREMLCKARRNS